MTAYYNENDPKKAAWLRELIKQDLIAAGEVDERSIENVQPDELLGFTQCHFFAGVGIWSYALRLAGWPDDRKAWTGSCPCQPFSVAGKSAGFADERHLWPAWFWLIKERAPSVVFGEQVASKDGYAWLDLVQTDMEGLDYAFGPVVLPAAGFGAPHGRHRIFFVADTEHSQRRAQQQTQRSGGRGPGLGRGCIAGTLADSPNIRRAQHEHEPGQRGTEGPNYAPECSRANDDLGNAVITRLEGHNRDDNNGNEPGRNGTHASGSTAQASGPVNGFWRDAEWLYCKDKKYRPAKPGTFPLAHGAPARMGRVCASCYEINAQNKDDEDMCILREVLSATRRSLATEVLQPRVHGAGIHQDADNEASGALPGTAALRRAEVRGMWEAGAVSPSPPQGRKSDEQRAGEHSDSMRQLPYGCSFPEPCERCGTETEWLAEVQINGNGRVTRLRGYGDGIVAEVAKAFIESYMEIQDA